MSRTTSAASRFWRSIFVIARRDFGAILFSRSFVFFLLGPLFPVFVVAMAGGIGASVSGKISNPKLGIAMEAQGPRPSFPRATGWPRPCRTCPSWWSS